MIESIVVQGGRRLTGTVRASGAKNAVLPILAATLLADGPCEIHNVPDLSDVHLMLEILQELGVQTSFEQGVVRTLVVDETISTAPYELVNAMRASICVLGPLLAKRKRAKVAQPGGCVIGARPIDLHVKGLKALGADLQTVHGFLEGSTDGLKGSLIFLGGPFGSTVTGTANVMMAAALAAGTTIVEQAACEPEVEDLANFLIAMGADIQGAGTPRVTVRGVPQLTGARHRVIPDRIEAETFMIAAAITAGDITVDDCRPDHMVAVTEVLREAGASVDVLAPTKVRVRGTRYVRAVDVTTFAYPGYPTDAQAQIMALMAIADGISVVTDKIYPDRYMHMAEYNRMGAQIRKIGSTAVVQGVEFLSGAPVKATDLRASAGLILAGLVADGETQMHQVHHLDRGYDRMEHKLVQLGAEIRRERREPRRRASDRSAA